MALKTETKTVQMTDLQIAVILQTINASMCDDKFVKTVNDSQPDEQPATRDEMICAKGFVQQHLEEVWMDDGDSELAF